MHNKFALGVVLFLVLAFFIFRYAQRKQAEIPIEGELAIEETSKKSDVDVPASITESSSVQEAETFLIPESYQYTSNLFGFTVTLPTRIYSLAAPLAAFEKEGERIIYFSPVISSDGVEKSYDGLRDSIYDHPIDPAGILLENSGIELEIRTVNSEGELTAFVKDYYGKSCEIASLVPFENIPDHFRIMLNEEEEDEEGFSLCPVLAKIHTWYSPKFKKAAIGFGQQDTLFWKVDPLDPSGYGTDLDAEIIESFRFIR